MPSYGIREVAPGATITLQTLGRAAAQNPSFRLIALIGGAVVVGPSTVGVTEDSPGNYDIQLVIPATLAAGDYAAEWQFSGVWVREPDIVRVGVPAGDGYTTVTDLRFALAPQGGQGPATAAQLSDNELADAISEAAQQVDARLGGLYTVPFPDGQVPPLVAQLTRDLAAYGATLTHRRFQPLADEHPVALRYEHAIALLKELASGKASLEGSPAGVSTATGEAFVENPYSGDLFTLDGLGIRSADRW
jgi:phage gp36-like protein